MDEYIRKSDAIEQALAQIHRLDITVRERILNFDGKAQAKTNADRIRSMTDEELLNWINGIPSACMDFDNESRCTLFDTCRECWLEWLKQECEP